MKNKILITGSAGFIGHHLISALVKDKYELVGIDNINDYYDRNLKYARLKLQGFYQEDIKKKHSIRSKKYSNIIFSYLDICDKEALEELFEIHNFDYVVHLAAQAGVRYSIRNPSAYIQSNLVGFNNLIQMCQKSNIEHFIYASSSSVYGLNKKIPFSTSDRVDYPISLYAATKKSNELIAHVYSHLYNLPTTGLRFFTVYGPLGRPDMAYFLFTKAILSDQPIKVFNNGKLSRDFTYIDDIIQGIKKVMVLPPKPIPQEGSGCVSPHKIYNIGNNSPVNLLEFIETIEDFLGKRAKKKYLPMQLGDVEKTYADISALIEDTGYMPSTNIREGLKQFIDWYVDYYICEPVER